MTEIATESRSTKPRRVRKSGPRNPAELCGEKRLRILDRATVAFLTHGFEGTNLEDVAIAAGVGKVTIYNYFIDKSDLFENVLLKAVQEMGRPLRDTLRLDQPLEDVLSRFAECYIERMLRPVAGTRRFHELARVLVGASLKHPEISRSCAVIFQNDLYAPLVQYMEIKVGMGELPRHQDCAFLATHFIQSLFFTNAVALDPSSAPAPEEIRDYAQRKVALFLYGSRGRPN